jgi:hypothetical protein
MNMHDEDLLGPLEERLADEARRMLDDSARAPMTSLRAELIRQGRRRTLAKTAGAVAAVIAVAIIATSSNRRPAAERGRAPTVAGDTTQPAANNRQGDVPLHPEIAPPIAAESGMPPGMAIALLIPATDDSGEPEFVPGWYVPEQVEVLSADDLSPAQRSAVSRLLGFEPENSDNEAI